MIPAIEIIIFEFLLNQFDRRVIDDPAYNSNSKTFARNLHRKWIIDDDPFDTNQILHPYAGTIYHGSARSAGLNFWESTGYTFLGSALWETAGETGRPSFNDQIATGVGGSFMGEALFRMASWTLEGEKNPSNWRENTAGLLSPPLLVNRRVFGDRFDAVFQSRNPAVFARAGLGGSLNTRVSNRGVSGDVSRNKLVGNFEMDYGLPGKSEYQYTRPFDYFHIEGIATSSPDAIVENIFARGLLVGREYGSSNYRGVAGVYGSFSYLSPELFQLSTTAVSLGTTGQWWLTNSLALQGTCLGGGGYGAAGTTTDTKADRDYHYGVVPQGLLALRLILGNFAMLDASARNYYVSGAGSNDNGRSENILREQLALTFRIYERHALGLQYDLSLRDAPDAAFADRRQSVETTSLVYSYLFGNTHAGLAAVK
ncbi:MAG: DUF3943 domain-containing protein [Planctomycetota bacterium]